MLEIVTHLLSTSNLLDLVDSGFHFDDASRGLRNAQQRLGFVPVFQLVRCKQTAVRHPRPTVLEANEATDFGFQRAADCIDKILQRTIAGHFFRNGA